MHEYLKTKQKKKKMNKVLLYFRFDTSENAKPYSETIAITRLNQHQHYYRTFSIEHSFKSIQIDRLN